MRPSWLNISDLSIFFGGCSRGSLYRAIKLAGLRPDLKNRYCVGWVEDAVQRHAPMVFMNHPTSPAALWRKFFEADSKLYQIRESLKALPIYGYGDDDDLTDEEMEARFEKEDREHARSVKESKANTGAPITDEDG